MKITPALLKRLPKVELHCHLDGSLRVPTIIDLAEKQRVELPSHNLDRLTKMLTIGKKRGTLEDYLEKFEITLSVLQTPESLIRKTQPQKMFATWKSATPLFCTQQWE